MRLLHNSIFLLYCICNHALMVIASVCCIFVQKNVDAPGSKAVSAYPNPNAALPVFCFGAVADNGVYNLQVMYIDSGYSASGARYNKLALDT